MIAVMMLLAFLAGCQISSQPPAETKTARLQNSQMAFVRVEKGSDLFEAISSQVVIIGAEDQIIPLTAAMISSAADTQTAGDYAASITVTEGTVTTSIELTVTVFDTTMDFTDLWADLADSFWYDASGQNGIYLSFIADDQDDIIQYACFADETWVFEAAIENFSVTQDDTYLFTGSGVWYNQQDSSQTAATAYTLTVSYKPAAETMTVLWQIDSSKIKVFAQSHEYVLTGHSYDECLDYYHSH